MSEVTHNEVETYPFQNPNLPLETRVDDLVSRLTLEEKISLIPTRQSEVKRLGIKEYRVGGEAAHGVARMGVATVFPQPIGLACTWNQSLIHNIGSVIGDEARVYYKKNGETGGLTLWAPTVDMERDPRWGRTEEAYGEDPYLAGEMTTALVKGMQGSHPFYLKMAAALKHFFGNNNEKDRCYCSVSIDPRNMKEYYWNAFKPAIVNGGVCSMMTAYNSINGRPCIVNPDVKNVVKQEWGLNGFIVCDGADFSQTVEMHHYYSTHAETAAEAIKSGIDCLTDKADLVRNAVRDALSMGLLTEEDIDNALKNIFKVRFRLGQFDPDSLNPYSSIPESKLCSPEHSALSLKATRESIVLLKNDNNALPLNKNKLNKIAVIGPLGNEVYTDWYSGTLPYAVSALQGIRNKLPDKVVTFNEGCDQITLTSVSNNKYVCAVNAGNDPLAAISSEFGPEETFDLTDWGWGNFTLKSHANGKYVIADGNLADGNLADGNLTTGNLTASTEEIKAWVIAEALNFIPQSDDSFALKTWNKKYVSTGDNSLLQVRDGNLLTDSEKFKKNIVVSGLNKAVEAAKDSDVAIVFVGNNPYINGKEEIDRPDITLPSAQEELIRSVYAANPNTIVVIIGSYPIAVNWANDNVPAILYSSHAGQEMGNAIADVLFGDYSPAGRLNMTWYSSVSQLPDIMDYDIIKGKRTYMYFDGTPLYPFGYGLTYTTFSYSNLILSSNAINADGQVNVSVDVKNIGTNASDEVVQLYVSADKSRVKRPFKELKGFKRIHLEPEQTETINFTLSASDLAFWDVTRDKFCVESGSYKIKVGSSSAHIKLSETLTVNGETVPPRDLTKLTRAENYDDYYGVLLDECKEGGTCVSYIDDGDWISFDDVDFGNGVTSFEAHVSSSLSGGNIEIRLDNVNGTLVGTCPVTNTGGWQAWVTKSCNISGASGIHKVYLKFTGSLNISWFRFK